MVEVQLADAITPDEFHDGDFSDRVAERKLDGVRLWSSEGRLYTRSGRDVTIQLPEIDAPEHHVLDGELVTADMEFRSANRRIQTEDRFKIDLLSDRYPATFVVFDAIEINGEDVSSKPLTERQALIEESIPAGANIVQVTTHDDPAEVWAMAEAGEWEGIMLKTPDAPYKGGRGDDWLKVKRWSEGTFPIVGYERTDNDGFVIYVNIDRDEPQKVAVNGERDQADVREADAAEVQYLERSIDGKLRKPSFKGVA